MDLTYQRPVAASRGSGGGGLFKLTLALVFVAWLGEAPIALDSALYNGKWRSVFVLLGWMLSPIPGIPVTPLQILAFLVLVLSLGAASRKRHAREMDRALLVALACIGVTFVWGIANGGTAYFAYYQLWRILLSFLIAYAVMSAIRSERDVLALGKLVVLAGLVRATLCNYYYMFYLAGTVDPTREYVTNHEDTILFVMAIQVLVLWAIFKGGRAAWLRAGLASVWILIAIVLNNRRLAWVELFLMAPVIYILLGPGPQRRKINRWAAIVAVPLLAYLVVGMSSKSPFFAPVHALTTTGSTQDASSLAREEEIRNLLRTLGEAGNPVFGTGWGRPYLMVERAYNNYAAEWILAPYTPHNSVVGLAAFSGLVGIFGIWGVVPFGAFLAVRGFRMAAANVVIRTASLASIGALVVYGVHCYGDIGLQSMQGAVLFGLALGVAGRVAIWPVGQPAPRAARFAGPLPPSRMPVPIGQPVFPRNAAWKNR